MYFKTDISQHFPPKYLEFHYNRFTGKIRLLLNNEPKLDELYLYKAGGQTQQLQTTLTQKILIRGNEEVRIEQQPQITFKDGLDEISLVMNFKKKFTIFFPMQVHLFINNKFVETFSGW